jgi:hypothetical protein
MNFTIEVGLTNYELSIDVAFACESLELLAHAVRERTAISRRIVNRFR